MLDRIFIYIYIYIYILYWKCHLPKYFKSQLIYGLFFHNSWSKPNQTNSKTRVVNLILIGILKFSWFSTLYMYPKCVQSTARKVNNVENASVREPFIDNRIYIYIDICLYSTVYIRF